MDLIESLLSWLEKRKILRPEHLLRFVNRAILGLLLLGALSSIRYALSDSTFISSRLADGPVGVVEIFPSSLSEFYFREILFYPIPAALGSYLAGEIASFVMKGFALASFSKRLGGFDQEEYLKTRLTLSQMKLFLELRHKRSIQAQRDEVYVPIGRSVVTSLWLLCFSYSGSAVIFLAHARQSFVPSDFVASVLLGGGTLTLLVLVAYLSRAAYSSMQAEDFKRRVDVFLSSRAKANAR